MAEAPPKTSKTPKATGKKEASMKQPPVDRLDAIRAEREAVELEKWKKKHDKKVLENARQTQAGILAGPLTIVMGFVMLFQGGWGFLWGPVLIIAGIAWFGNAVGSRKAHPKVWTSNELTGTEAEEVSRVMSMSWQEAQGQVAARRAAKRERLAALSPEARKRRKRWVAVLGTVAVLFVIGIVASPASPGKSVGVTGWQNPTGKQVLLSVKAYALGDASRGLGSEKGVTEWVVEPFETRDSGSVVKQVPCSGDGLVGITVFAFNTADEHDSGYLLTGVAKCGSTVRCGIVLDLDLNPRLSGCQG